MIYIKATQSSQDFHRLRISRLRISYSRQYIIQKRRLSWINIIIIIFYIWFIRELQVNRSISDHHNINELNLNKKELMFFEVKIPKKRNTISKIPVWILCHVSNTNIFLLPVCFPVQTHVNIKSLRFSRTIKLSSMKFSISIISLLCYASNRL